MKPNINLATSEIRLIQEDSYIRLYAWKLLAYSGSQPSTI